MADLNEGTQVPNENGEQVTPKQGGGRSLKGAKADTVAKAGIPIPAPRKLAAPSAIYPNSYEFPIAQLVKVSHDPTKMVKRNDVETPTPVLTFVYVSTDGKQFTDVIFPIEEEDDDKFFKEVEILNQKMMHIWDETIGRQAFVENSMDGGETDDDRENFRIMFNNIAIAYNAVLVDSPVKGTTEMKKVPAYTKNPVYVKFTYYKDRLQVPKFPNWIQRAFNAKNEQVVCELAINPSYDKLEATAKAVNPKNDNYGGGARNNDFSPTGNTAGYPDFPDVP